MKADLDTIIYLIVTILFVALGALGKKKPKQQAVQDTSPDMDEVPDREEQQSADVLSENLRRLLGDYGEYGSRANGITGQEISVEVPEEEIVPEAEKLDSFKDAIDRVEGAVDSVEDAMAMNMEDSYIEDQIKMSELGGKEQDATYGHDIDRLLENFEIRKAIIYSEIINPKYF